MTKLEFLDRLRGELCGLSEEDIQCILDYYAEMIDDRIENGMSEGEAVACLGDIKELAREAMLDLPLPKVIKQRCKKNRAWKVWEIICIVFATLTVGAVLAATLLTVYAMLWVLVAVLWVTDLSLLVCAVFGVVMFGVSVAVSPFGALLYLGVGLFGAGAAVLLFFGCVKLTVLFVKAHAKVARSIKSKIIGKAEKV